MYLDFKIFFELGPKVLWELSEWKLHLKLLFVDGDDDDDKLFLLNGWLKKKRKGLLSAVIIVRDPQNYKYPTHPELDLRLC